MSFKILAKTLSNNQVLTFTNVDSYTIEDGFLKFVDSRTNKIRLFKAGNVEVEEE